MLAGFLLGTWASYRLLRAELYEYAKHPAETKPPFKTCFQAKAAQ